MSKQTFYHCPNHPRLRDELTIVLAANGRRCCTICASSVMEILQDDDSFQILQDAAGEGRAIYCKFCKSTSHNPNDVEQRYCGRCRQFHDFFKAGGAE